jgi:hypothetical protein
MTLPQAITAVRAGQKSEVHCPNTRGHKHGDRRPSLIVFLGKDQWVGFKCWTGCTRDEVLAAAGLKVRDLGPDRPFEPKQARALCNSPKAAPAALPALSTPPNPEKVAQRALWPRLMVPETWALEAIMKVRGISIEGLKLAVERGILCAGYHHDLPCWFVTDEHRIAAQARRIDGQRFFSADGLKAVSLTGTVGGWPIGAAAIRSEHRSVIFCEGGPDLLAAHAFIWAEGREHDAAAVAMLGASSPIANGALELFRGRRVRFVVHADTAGAKGLARWGPQLRGIAASRDSICFKGLHRADGEHVKDLNDALLVDADTFENARILWGLVP